MRPTRAIVLLLLAALLAATALPATAGAASRKVPHGWLGVTFTPAIAARHRISFDHELALMRRNGVESVRVAVYWFQLQPKRNRRPSYRALDAIVESGARHGIAVAPVVIGAPPWAAARDSRSSMPQPKDPATFARFLRGLVKRYGSKGSFWRSHHALPRTPVRAWQIWNEVSNPYYWDQDTWTTAYPRLLRASYEAVKRADPRAQVVMSGLNTVGAGKGVLPSWQALDRIYDALDADGLGRPYDAVAAHIYTSRVSDAVRVVRETRKVMNARGDARPIDVTELSWPASRHHLRDARGRRRSFFAETDSRGMARRLTEGVRALAAQRRALGIGGVDWYQWLSPYSGTVDAFSYSGLRRAGRRTRDMPALRAFRGIAGRLEGRRLRG